MVSETLTDIARIIQERGRENVRSYYCCADTPEEHLECVALACDNFGHAMGAGCGGIIFGEDEIKPALEDAIKDGWLLTPEHVLCAACKARQAAA